MLDKNVKKREKRHKPEKVLKTIDFHIYNEHWEKIPFQEFYHNQEQNIITLEGRTYCNEKESDKASACTCTNTCADIKQCADDRICGRCDSDRATEHDRTASAVTGRDDRAGGSTTATG